MDTAARLKERGRAAAVGMIVPDGVICLLIKIGMIEQCHWVIYENAQTLVKQ